MKRKISHCFFALGIVCSILAFAILSVRGYLGDEFFDSPKDYFSPASQFLHPEKKVFSFAVVSDTGSNNLILQSVINVIRKDKKADYQFVLHLGDLINDRPEAHLYWILKEIEPKLKHLPFYITPGNHDIHFKTGISKKEYKMIFGPENYWFGYGDTLFISYDSSEEKITDEQISWIKKILAITRPSFKNCIIYSHVPPINGKSVKDHGLDAESSRKLEEALIRSEYKFTALRTYALFFERGICGYSNVYGTLCRTKDTLRH